MRKWQGKWKPKTFEKSVEISLTKNEEFQIIRRAAIRYPELFKVLVENPTWECPFPFECNAFPCGEDGCRADTCDNGYAYRQS